MHGRVPQNSHEMETAEMAINGRMNKQAGLFLRWNVIQLELKKEGDSDTRTLKTLYSLK